MNVLFYDIFFDRTLWLLELLEIKRVMQKLALWWKLIKERRVLMLRKGSRSVVREILAAHFQQLTVLLLK